MTVIVPSALGDFRDAASRRLWRESRDQPNAPARVRRMAAVATGSQQSSADISVSDSAKSVRVERPRLWVRDVFAFLGFVAFSVYATWPLAGHPATRVPYNLIDPLLNVWIFSWGAHAIVHAPLSFFNANMFFPDHLTFAFTESNIGQSLPVAPIYWLTGNGVLMVNIALLTLYAVGSFGAYLLAREFGAPRSAAFVAGIAFGLSPYRLSQAVHIHVAALHVIPFVLVLLVRLRTRPARWLVPAIGVTLAYQVWSSLSGGAITACAIAVWAAWELGTRRRAALPALRSAAVGCVIAGVLVVPLLIPYIQARRMYPDQYAHPPQEVLDLSARWRSYLSPALSGGPIVDGPNRWIERQHGDEPGAWEKHLFPGWTLSLAALIAVGGAITAWLRRRTAPRVDGVGFALALTVAGVVLSLGPRLGGDPSGLPLPFALLTLTPGHLLRVPARFGSIVALGLGLGVALTLAKARVRWRPGLAALLVLGFAIELMPTQFPTVRAPDINSAHRAINGRPGGVLALPTVEILHEQVGGAIGLLEREPVHLYLSTAHFRPVVNGYSAFQTPEWWQVVRNVQDFPSVPSIRALQGRGVQTVVIESSMVGGTRWEHTGERLAAWPGARLLARAKGTLVYDISRASTAGP
jgi:hypothetical protein